MKKRIRRGEKGFSLVEMLMAVGISAMIAYAIFAVMRAGEIQIQNTQVKMAVQDSLREGTYKMIQELRLSAPDRITIGANGNSVQFDVPDPSSPVNADYTANWTSAHTIQYALGGANNTQIIRTDMTTGSTSVMANDVTALSFTGNGANPTLVTVTTSGQRTLLDGSLMPLTPLQLTAQAEVKNV